MTFSSGSGLTMGSVLDLTPRHDAIIGHGPLATLPDSTYCTLYLACRNKLGINAGSDAFDGLIEQRTRKDEATVTTYSSLSVWHRYLTP